MSYVIYKEDFFAMEKILSLLRELITIFFFDKNKKIFFKKK
jgi:hypothetical protein